MKQDAKIFVAGHRGMVGSAIVRRLKAAGFHNVITRTRDQLDLFQQGAVNSFLEAERPDYVVIAAARVGGIHANNMYRAEFIYQNLMIEANLIHGAHLAGVQRLMMLGSSCIYPRDCPQPICEDYLLTGPLEPTNEPYAVAKIAGVKLCDSYNRQYGRQYICVMPTNLYGINDNYNLDTGHVIPALLRKAHEARVRGDSECVIWGSGSPRREFLYVDDMGDACVHLMASDYDGPMLNVGTGMDVTIRELANMIFELVGFKGRLVFDATKPDGTPRKLLDVSRLAALGWRSKIELPVGLMLAYDSAPFLKQTAARTPSLEAGLALQD